MVSKNVEFSKTKKDKVKCKFFLDPKSKISYFLVD
jgi:hypothetical protein